MADKDGFMSEEDVRKELSVSHEDMKAAFFSELEKDRLNEWLLENTRPCLPKEFTLAGFEELFSTPHPLRVTVGKVVIGKSDPIGEPHSDYFGTGSEQ